QPVASRHTAAIIIVRIIISYAAVNPGRMFMANGSDRIHDLSHPSCNSRAKGPSARSGCSPPPAARCRGGRRGFRGNFPFQAGRLHVPATTSLPGAYTRRVLLSLATGLALAADWGLAIGSPGSRLIPGPTFVPTPGRC